MNKSYTIAIVEDDEIFLKTLKETLEESGFEVKTAKDGEEGLELISSSKPSVVILDIIMPKIDGITLLKLLRQKEWGKTMPVILLTVVAPDDAMIKTIAENEPAYYLIKERWRLEEIVEKVKECLGISK